MDWTGVDFCFYQLFRLSFWRHPFTAEDPLLSKWCNAKCLRICSDEGTWFPEDEYIFSKFDYNYSFNLHGTWNIPLNAYLLGINIYTAFNSL